MPTGQLDGGRFFSMENVSFQYEIDKENTFVWFRKVKIFLNDLKAHKYSQRRIPTIAVCQALKRDQSDPEKWS